MANLPDVPSTNDRPIPAEDWFNARFRKPNGEPYSPRTRAVHLKRLGIEPLVVGWSRIVDPATADRRVLELAAEQSSKIAKG